MHSMLRILIMVLSGAAGLAAIYVIQFPGALPNAKAIELASVTLLLAATLLSLGIDLSRHARPPSRAEPDTRSPDMPTSPATHDEPVQGEVTKVLNLLRNYSDANVSFSRVLDRAKEELPESLKAEEVRIIISYLMIENDNMRARTANLQANLEKSQEQIERLKSNLATAEAQGLSDPLTGVNNRRSFDIILASQVAALRNSSQPLSLILADIDHFKAINDRYGHPVGDDVLKWFAKVLTANLKGRDTVARYGGEEFAVILPQTPLENAFKIAAQIKAQLESQFWQKPDAPNTMLRVTASFGVAQLSQGEGTSSLISRADAKLYQAKADGRNRVAA
jgi:diguanylate cyclase